MSFYVLSSFLSESTKIMNLKLAEKRASFPKVTFSNSKSFDFGKI